MRIASLPVRAPTAALVVSSCATLAAVTAWLLVAPATRDTCALPGNSAALSPPAQDLLAKHAVACSDLVHDRITHDQYLQLIGLVAPVAPPPVPEIEWASTVRAVSSQYTDTSWSAQQVLGPPDVFPSAGDNAKAWASLTADGGDEFIEVGFAHAYPISELAIYETYNPGAVKTIELITASGKHIVHDAPPEAMIDGKPSVASHRLSLALDCGEPIIAARITLASGQVAGWNEIDAIGATTCTPGDTVLTFTE